MSVFTAAEPTARSHATDVADGGVEHTADRRRKFVGRAVTWAARTRGIRYYIDLNSGLPSGQGAHAAARMMATGV
jgi:hypothetical protein